MQRNHNIYNKTAGDLRLITIVAVEEDSPLMLRAEAWYRAVSKKSQLGKNNGAQET